MGYDACMKILIVEDEIKLNKALAQGLSLRGYATDSAFDGEEGERMAKVNEYDLVVLDVMMPKRDGVTVCRNIRAAGKTMPVIMLTAKDAVPEKVAGLDAGADDYVVKPFSFEELVARIRSLLRRPALAVADIITVTGAQGDIVMDTRTQKVSCGGKPIELTLREYGLLEFLLRNQNDVVTRSALLEHVWESNYDAFSNVVDVHMKNLRKKLPSAYAKRITTVWGKGYQFI